MAVIKRKTGINGVTKRFSSRIMELTRELEQLLKTEENEPSLDGDLDQVFDSGKRSRNSELETRIDRLLRLKEVLELIPVSKSTWWEGVKCGRYPAPVRHLGPRITAWKLSEVMQLVNGGGHSHA
jgi:prophage regulatory protein